MPALAEHKRAEIAGTPEETEGGFGIYVHWPFCLSKCPYCDFNSHVTRDVGEDAYADAIIRELTYFRELTGPRNADSLFFGGGTPSLMTPQAVGRIIDAAAGLWNLGQGAEISMEANPTSVETAYLKGYAGAGVNRLSLGVQALSDDDLRFLGRLHSVAEALEAVKLARSVFPRISFDLIYARPAQTPLEWKKELEEAISYAADHLSLYQLTIEPGTAFEKLYAKGALLPPSADDAAVLYEVTQEVCAKAGLPAYEVSNHARPGAECRHNLVYWRYGDYAGAGPGAHGRITREGKRIATETEKSPARWAENVAREGHGLIGREEVPGNAAGDEMMMMGLRLSEGVPLARFEKLRGRKIDETRLALLEKDGLISRAKGRLTATPRGRMVLDKLLGELLVE
ncbi:radical SAM family heme chaperone HemW [Tepidicaulis sp. LMO-SS28]|uniref:radical SAM family heme chaperone HemW n=1 Tax=Tepidicaulis sp. LMO-SS28 TaxID=3447455 RepID=UPI003EE2D962